MNSFEYVLNQQRALVQRLNNRTLMLELAIITAASHVIKGNTEAAIEIILDTSEMITNNETNSNTAKAT